MGRQIQMLGFSLAAFLCVALGVLKLTIEVDWSWLVTACMWKTASAFREPEVSSFNDSS